MENKKLNPSREDNIYSLFESVIPDFHKAKKGVNGWMTSKCPLHEDKNPSFSFNLNGGWNCFSWSIDPPIENNHNLLFLDHHHCFCVAPMLCCPLSFCFCHDCLGCKCKKDGWGCWRIWKSPISLLFGICNGAPRPSRPTRLGCRLAAPLSTIHG